MNNAVDVARPDASMMAGDEVATVSQLVSEAVNFQLVLPDAGTDYIQGKLAAGEIYELELLEDLARRVGPGSLVLDVGANIGSHTCYLAAAGLVVVAFEPDPHLVGALKESVALNGFLDRVEVRGYAIGAVPGRGVLVTPDSSNLGTQHIRIGIATDSTGTSGVETPILTLDQQSYPGRVAAIKIDVEGMELDVLSGALALLEQDLPLVYVEALSSVHFSDISEQLGLLGYRYRATFNYSPTHLFEPGYDRLDSELLGALSGLANRMYTAEDALRTAQEHLNNANAKYRSATALIGSLRADATRSAAASEPEAPSAQAIQVHDLMQLLEASHSREVGQAQRAITLQSSIDERDDEIRTLSETISSASTASELKALRTRLERAVLQRDQLVERLRTASVRAAGGRRREARLRQQIEQAAMAVENASAELAAARETLEERRVANVALQALVEKERSVIAELRERGAVLEYDLQRNHTRSARWKADLVVLRAWISSAQERERDLDAQVMELQADKGARKRSADLEAEVLALKERFRSQVELAQRRQSASDIQIESVHQQLAADDKLARERQIALKAEIQTLHEQRAAEKALAHDRQSALSAQVRSLGEQVEQRADEARSLREQVEVGRRHHTQLIGIRKGKTYRLGAAVREGFSSVRGFFRMPFALIALMRDRDSQTAPPAQQHDDQQRDTN